MGTSATPTLHRDCGFSRLRTPCDESDWTRCPRLVSKINAEPILNGLRKREQPSFAFDPACTTSLSALILKYVTGHVDTIAVVTGGDETDMVRSSKTKAKETTKGGEVSPSAAPPSCGGVSTAAPPAPRPCPRTPGPSPSFVCSWRNIARERHVAWHAQQGRPQQLLMQFQPGGSLRGTSKQSE